MHLNLAKQPKCAFSGTAAGVGMLGGLFLSRWAVLMLRMHDCCWPECQAHCKLQVTSGVAHLLSKVGESIFKKSFQVSRMMDSREVEKKICWEVLILGKGSSHMKSFIRLLPCYEASNLQHQVQKASKRKRCVCVTSHWMCLTDQVTSLSLCLNS